MHLEMSSSSSRAAYNSDSCISPRDAMRSGCCYEAQEESSDEVRFEDFGYDPFVDCSSLKMLDAMPEDRRCKERSAKRRRIASVPVIRRRHQIDFWRDFGCGEIFSLPTLGTGRCDSIRRISVDIAKQVVEGVYNVDYQIVDCRFSYEYNGGHIVGAVNMSTAGEIVKFFKNPKVLIFHCEFSSIRAPRLAQRLRNMDRTRNPYPKLTIPEIYIMEGGYKQFYSTYPELCVPKGYVTMDSVDHRAIHKIEQQKARQSKRK